MKRMFGVMYTGINAESTQGLRDHDVGCDRTCAWDTRSTNLFLLHFFSLCSHKSAWAGERD